MCEANISEELTLHFSWYHLEQLIVEKIKINKQDLTTID